MFLRILFIVTLSILLDYTPALAMHSDTLVGNLDKELGAEPRKTKNIKFKIRRKYHNKFYGEEFPHRPYRVEYSPKRIKIPKKVLIPEYLLTKKRILNLESLNQFVLRDLSSEQFSVLFNYLSQKKVQLLWWDKKNHRHSGHNRRYRKATLGIIKKDKTNAAAAIALSMASHKHYDIFARIVGLFPAATLPEIRGHAKALLSKETTANILVNMVKLLDSAEIGCASIVSKFAAELALKYIAYWSHKNAKEIHKNLHDLFIVIDHEVKKNESAFNEKKMGVLLGSVLAGSFIHLESIVKVDKRRQWLINNTCNMIWASTAFLGAIPMGGAQAGAVVSGTISMTVVAGAGAYSLFGGHKNLTPTVMEILGHIESAALDACEGAHDKETRALLMLKWIQVALHSNGFSA